MLPAFSWDPSTISEPVINLAVAFNDGKTDDIAKLTRQPVTYITMEEEEAENDCLLLGQLMDESNAAVIVSGCPGSDNYEVLHDVIHATKL